MVLQLEPAGAGNLHLTFFDVGVDELLDAAALQTHQMVVVLPH